MEGGQKTPINLEAGLNINTSDMLTPLASQTFQHNWQKFQGKFLPNSLRFEKNGWAAGWNVYNFDYNSFRKEQNGLWMGVGSFNTYTKTINLFAEEKGYDPLHTVYVVPQTVVTVGDVVVAGNAITGKVKNKNFSLTWDPVAHTLSQSDPTIGLDYVVNGDYSVTATVTDLSSTFHYDFNLALPSKLSGDAVDGVSYSGFANNEHKWGQYVYNVNTGNLTTPEGVTVTPTVAGNQITFDYAVSISDENEEIKYQLVKHYPKFEGVTWQDQTNKEKLLLGGAPSEALAFDRYSTDVTPRTLLARDEDGVVINYKVPLWAVAKLSVNRSNPNAKKCDNVNSYEVATNQGTGLNQGGKYTNIWDGDGTFTIANSYRPSYAKYISGLSHRFNEILLNNTIEPSPTWHYQRSRLNSQVWYKTSRQYKNIRDHVTTLMTRYLGNVYTWGAFTVNANTLAAYNNPYDWSNASNCVYTDDDISEILTFKPVGAANNTNDGDDEDYVATLAALDETIIATLTGTTAAYVSTQAAQTYAQLYTNGVYTSTTYEDTPITDEPFWPFEKVPKFNYTDGNGITHTGVYYTNGADIIIDDLFTFKNLVLGNYEADIDPMNNFTTPDTSYNRTRVVKCYKAGFDFDFLKRSSYSSEQDYNVDKKAWNAVWEKYYPGVISPQDSFSENDTSEDDTYLAYNEITVLQNVDPQIQYVTPGVYVFGVRAVPYNNDAGLIIYEGGGYSLSANVWHHSAAADSSYNVLTKHEEGHMVCDGYTMDLPFYFGGRTQQNLVYGANKNRFRENRVLATLESAKLTMALNYTVTLVAHTYEHGTYHTWEWTRGSIGPTCWLGYLHASYASGAVTIYDATLASGVESVSRYQYTGDINEGIRFAWPVWGNSATRLTYPEIANINNISDANTFILTTVPTADLTADLTEINKIYFDRGDTDKSMHLFRVIEKSRQPDNFDGTGNFCVTLEAVNGGFLYYAKKQFDREQNEIFADYYIPGIAWGNPDNDSGNMEKVADYPILEIDWRPYVRNFPTNLVTTFSKKNTSSSAHKFYESDCMQLNSLNYVLGIIDIDTMEMPITIATPTGDLEITFNGDTQQTEVPAHIWMTNNFEEVENELYTGMGDIVKVPLAIQLQYKNNKAKFITLSNSTLVTSDGTKCVITDGVSTITYNINQQKVTQPTTGTDTQVTTEDGVQHVIIDGKTFTMITAYLAAVYDGTMSGNTVTFQYNGMTFTFDFDEVNDSGISVLSTDIRTPEKTRTIGKIRPEGQYQFLRQQWNTTVEVENYWWIDSKHVLELNQAFFVLKRNTGELDDWNGHRFEKIYEIPRDRVLPTNIIRYFATNTYNSKYPALFCTLQEEAGAILITVMNSRRNMGNVMEQYIRIKQREIGEELNSQNIDGGTAIFNTYNPLTAAQILSNATWSHTIVDHWLIIGCHLSNNYDQWSIVINLDNTSLTKVIQGYGYVGLHGELTGGQIPNDYFDVTKGFNGKVEPLSVLVGTDDVDYNDLDAVYEVQNIADINNITARVVGTSEQQWYIKRKLYGIVSHLTFNNGNFTKQVIPITNNFTAAYSSPSWGSSVMGDLFVQVVAFASMASFDGAAAAVWNSFMALIGYPMLYSIAPRYAQIAYLQQTFGQYAYVHYNSSKSLPEKEQGDGNTDSGMSGPKNKQSDPVLSGSFTFDKQKFSQNESTSLDFFEGIMPILIASFTDSLQVLDKKQSVNEEQNQSAISDVGKKFVDNAMANAGDMLASAIISQSKNDSGVTSVVTGLKSIDMFYSTSDQQHVFAGPGFVEHQFVADCVAQSVTDTQVEGKVQQLYFCIRALTTIQTNLTIKLEELAADALDKSADATAAQMVCGTSLGAVAVGIHAAAAVLRTAIAAQKNAMVEIDKILDAICARGITVNVDGAVSRHALSIEGKHKYGEKNEVFMWPCFGVQPGQIKYTDEWVEAGIKNTPWALTLNSVKFWRSGLMNMANLIMRWHKPNHSCIDIGSIGEAKSNCGDVTSWGPTMGQDNFEKPGNAYRAYYMNGRVPFHQVAPFGKAEERTLPDDMACVEGVCRFLPNEPFKNENIGVSDPAFAPSMQQDYIIDKAWDISQYCTYGMQQWVGIKDTKLIDCPPSNMVVSSTFCGVACPYTAVEVRRGIEKAYMRPWAITPNTLALNCTGYNAILQDKLYHAFDGISYRLVNLIGSPGLNKSRQSFFYSFQVNDRFKRSNKVPANELQGNFEADPVQAVDSIDKLYTLMTIASKEKGLEAGTIGEDKDLIRWAVPVFTEHVSTLPAAVKTMTAMTLGVVEGVTSLCVDLANNQSAYKAPLSVDFTIGKNVYRATEEYICSVQTQNGIDIVTDLVPTLGLKYIGSTPTEAYFYSKSTRCYYTFTGSSLTKMDMMERFRDIQKGYWDFVNQEVIMPCLMTFKRLNAEVEDTDTETDNIIVPVLSKNQVSGELPPPITTIFNDHSWYKVVSLPCGLAYQGPNRVIINRAVFCEYMERSIKDNFGKWKKMDREKYVTHREYPEIYTDIMKDVQGVDGWTYNPFVLVTSALGMSEDTDCIFEWNITFCWPVEMDLLYGPDNFACVNIIAETMTPGGKQVTRPTHIFLNKELFTRTGNYGYYSFRFQSKNGMGNRERLHIWSDQYIAISSIDCECKSVTQRRNEQLTQQVDVKNLKEL